MFSFFSEISEKFIVIHQKHTPPRGVRIHFSQFQNPIKKNILDALNYFLVTSQLFPCESYHNTNKTNSYSNLNILPTIWLFMSIISTIINTLSNFIELLIVNNMTDFMLQFNELSLHIVTWFEIEMSSGKEFFIAWLHENLE